jgi:tetratricopeptide (TPR) repeat protein
MELVKGISITDYCDQSHLSTTERLQLFIKVCHAVQHAHQKGIIHRDIKPSNVLVTLHDSEPVPKVIDFGIAKALGQKLTDKTLFTGFAQMMGTPAYMSPEQAELSGLDIDTRSDIYSLGVLLYELLTGVTPFDREAFARATLDEIRRMIRETDPPKPSTRLRTLGAKLTDVAKRRHTEPANLQRLVAGDLDWIVMKCLEKDRNRRYETANAVARDAERFLHSEPIAARPPSQLYRLGKIVRRNRVAFTAAATVILALALGFGVSMWLLVRERSARAKSQKVADFFKEALGGIKPSVAKGQDTTLLRRILDDTTISVDKALAGDPDLRADLLTTLGQVYIALGEYSPAITNLQKAVAIYRTIAPGSLELANSLDILSEPLWKSGNAREAEKWSGEALGARTNHLARNSQEVATSLNNLGVILGEEGELDRGQALLEEALSIQRRLAVKDEARIAETLTALSTIHWKKREFKKAEEVEREALALHEKITGSMDPDVALTLNNLATVLLDEGELKAAVAASRRALQIQTNLFKYDHPDKAMTLYNLGKGLWLLKELDEAERTYRELLTVWKRLLGPENAQVARTLNNLATVLADEGSLDDAAATHRQALDMYRKLGLDAEAAVSLNNLAFVLLQQNKFADAEPLLQETVKILTADGQQPENLATCLRTYSGVQRQLGRIEAAEQTMRTCLALCERERSLQDNWRKFDAMSVLGGILLLREGCDKVEQLLLAGHEGLHQRSEKIPVANRPRLKQTFDRLIALYEAWDKPQKALEWKRKLAEFEQANNVQP